MVSSQSQGRHATSLLLTRIGHAVNHGQRPSPARLPASACLSIWHTPQAAYTRSQTLDNTVDKFEAAQLTAYS